MKINTDKCFEPFAIAALVTLITQILFLVVSITELTSLIMIMLFVFFGNYIVTAIYLGFKFCKIFDKIIIPSLLFLLFKFAELVWSCVYMSVVSRLCDVWNQDYAGLAVIFACWLGIITSVVVYFAVVLGIKIKSMRVQSIIWLVLFFVPMIIFAIVNNVSYRASEILNYIAVIYYVAMVTASLISLVARAKFEHDKNKIEEETENK